MLLWPACCLLLLTLRPLDNPDLWWTLARGRAAMSGPAAVESLLLLPGAAAAHWADGWLWFSLWNIGGFLLLQWTPLVVGCCVLWRLGLFSSRHPSISALLLPCLLLMLLRPVLQPGPLLNAIACLLLLDAVCRLQGSRIRVCGGVGITMAVWANTAVWPLWGLLWLLIQPPPPRSAGRGSVRQPPAQSLRLPVLVVAGLGTCLNPRGPLVLADDILSLTAAARSEWRGWLLATAADAPFAATVRPLTFQPMLLATCIGLVLAAGIQRQKNLRWGGCSLLLLVVTLIVNPDCLPLCAVLALLQGTVPARTRNDKRPAANSGLSGWTRFRGLAVIVLLIAGMLTDATGAGPFATSRIGWGLAQTLDARLLDLPVTSSGDRPVIWAAERRTAGLAAWSSDAVRLLDHPLTALQWGRLSEHLRLVQDLRGGRRAAYRLPDGTTGGWHRQLQRWQVSMLLTPVECCSLNAALQRSTWKLADLDSPNLPWLTSESDSAAALIQELAAQQNFVQWGSWRADAAVYDSAGVRVDLCELAGLGIDPDPALRQAALFRSQRLPLAAIRALGPVRTGLSRLLSGDNRVLAAVHDCERDLAEMEWDNYGTPGLWRRMLLQQLALGLKSARAPYPWEAELPLEPGRSGAELAEIVSACVAGRLQDALRIAGSGSPETLAERQYAAAMIQLEAGDVSKAREELMRLLDALPVTSADAQSSLRLAARGWLELTGGPGGQHP
jgi:hypothetical protein